ncbi:HEPN/Toprim-associated domain-containing protein [Pseudomonas brassicacearum]|nr:hypothetical protein PflQ8_1880 [Pseudomonas fluorescens Q8r1-96]
MSSYASLTLDGMAILDTQNYYHEWYFKKSERHIELIDSSEYYADEFVKPGEKIEKYYYAMSARTLRRRLDLAGYNRESLEQEFKEQHYRLMSDLNEMLDLAPNKVIKYISTVKQAKIDDWLDCLREIKLTREGTEINNATGTGDPILKEFMLSIDTFFTDWPTCGNYNFPCMSEEGYAVALLEITGDDAECVLDVTDLVHSGWTQAFDDLVEYNQDFTKFYEIFNTSLLDIKALTTLSPENPILARLLYAAVITAMETYLSDTLKKQVINREAIKRKFVRNHDGFKDKKFTTSAIFEKLATLNEDIISEIDKISFHNLDRTPGLYKSVLSTNFPETHLPELKIAINNRHDIVHRNGKSSHDKILRLDMNDVDSLIGLVDDCIKHIDKQIKDGLLDDIEMIDKA